MTRNRPLAVGAAVLALGWTISISTLLAGWRSTLTRSQRETLDLRAGLAAQVLRACTQRNGDSCPADSARWALSGGEDLSVRIIPRSRRILPPGSPPEERFVPSRDARCLVAEQDLPRDRVLRLELPTGSSRLPRSAWTLSGISAAMGTLLPLGLLLWLLRRERLRSSHLVEVARSVDQGRPPPPPPVGISGEDAHLVATLGADLRRRRILAHWETRRMGRLLDPLSEGVVLLDGQLRVLVCNASAASALEFRIPKAAARKRPLVSLASDLGFLDDLRRAVARGIPATFEMEGRGRVHLVRLWPVPADPDGNGWLVSLRDATEQRRAERLQARLVSDASHEFKTPLTSIRGWTETLLDDETDNFRRRALERVVQGTRHLEEVVRDLLDLGRLAEAPERRMDEVSLAEICREAIATLDRQAESKRTRIALDCPESASLPAHRGQLVRAILNLLSNAVRHSPDGEVVTVSVVAAPDEWRVEVRDHGPGIPPEFLPHLFERFYRADHGRSRDLGGTGLGLAIVKETAQTHGGRAEVESVPGEGATFRIVLPRPTVVS